MWQDLISAPETLTLPWFGRGVRDATRTWRLRGTRPPEHGWYKFETDGRYCTCVDVAEPDLDYADQYPRVLGYVVGNRVITDSARVTVEVDQFLTQTERVYCVDLEVDRFARVLCARTPEGLVYCGLDFSAGPEGEVRDAYDDRADTVSMIPGVTPALDLAFRWATHYRADAERRRREAEERRAREAAERAERERIQELAQHTGTAQGRRAMVQVDFEQAARSALEISGAQYLSHRKVQGAWAVRYRFMAQRLECIVDHNLWVIDAGICLTDHATGKRYDTELSLEALPGVVREALDLGVLVVWRHG